MSARCKAVWASLAAAVILCGIFAEAHLFVPALVCTAWMIFVAVCNWVAEYRDEKRADLLHQNRLKQVHER